MYQNTGKKLNVANVVFSNIQIVYSLTKYQNHTPQKQAPLQPSVSIPTILHPFALIPFFIPQLYHIDSSLIILPSIMCGAFYHSQLIYRQTHLSDVCESQIAWGIPCSHRENMHTPLSQNPCFGSDPGRWSSVTVTLTAVPLCRSILLVLSPT